MLKLDPWKRRLELSICWSNWTLGTGSELQVGSRYYLAAKQDGMSGEL
jgi:hypothetical protein